MEEVIGSLQAILALGLSMGEKRGHFFSHVTHETIYPLILAVGRPFEELFPMRRVLDLLAPAEGSCMAGDLPLIDHYFHMVRIRKDGCRRTGIIRRNGVAVRVELNEGGLPDRGRDHPVRSIGDSRKSKERFLHEHRCGRPLRGPVDPLVSLPPPMVCLSVEVTDIDKIMCLDVASDIPYHPFDPSFFIRPARRAGMDCEVIVAGEVEELNVEGELRSSSDDHALEIVVPVFPGSPFNLFVGLEVTV